MAVGFWTDFRRFFLRGLAATLPTLLTVAIVLYVFNFIQNHIGEPINDFLTRALQPLFRDVDLGKLWADHWYLRGIGFLVAVIGVYLIGRLVASFVGRSLWNMIEHTLTRTPLIKQIYPNVKQVTDFLLSENRLEFSRVVAVEYPRKGVWSLGLVTGSGLPRLRTALGPELLTVFIPSSPTPVTGYTITVRRDEAIDVPMTIDEALRFTVSGGVLIPPLDRLPPGASGRAPAPVGPPAGAGAEGKETGT